MACELSKRACLSPASALACRQPLKAWKRLPWITKHCTIVLPLLSCSFFKIKYDSNQTLTMFCQVINGALSTVSSSSPSLSSPTWTPSLETTRTCAAPGDLSLNRKTILCIHSLFLAMFSLDSHWITRHTHYEALTPMSDHDWVSPYNIHTIYSKQVMRIERNIN